MHDTVIKNVTVAFRIMLFYRPMWASGHVWDSAANDVLWPISLDVEQMMDIIESHCKAREKYLMTKNTGAAKPFKMTPALKVLLSAIDEFRAGFDKCRNQSSPTDQEINTRRNEWRKILKQDPMFLLNADFDPNSADGRPGMFSGSNLPVLNPHIFSS